jgi:4-diphosphocytidyl-2-C-methyl-D-erythritol kinase
MLTVKAPAKVNWFLKVFGLRSDGYHDIKSLMHKISLYDEMSFVQSNKLTIKTDFRVSTKDNLVYKAAVLLKKLCNVDTGAEISLKKNIPVSAGLGGGSSDAAYTLVGLNELWSLGLSMKDLSSFAEKIGSDVPFFLSGNLCYIEGRGEKTTLLRAVNPFYLLLVKPPISVSTRWVYENYRKGKALSQNSHLNSPPGIRKNGTDKKLTKNIDTLDNIKYFFQDAISLQDQKNTDNFNDLESVTAQRFPVIEDIKQGLQQQGALFSLMSGSGPTVFGVFKNSEAATSASNSFDEYWTAAVQTLAD